MDRALRTCAFSLRTVSKLRVPGAGRTVCCPPTITNHHQPHPSDSESTKNQPYEFECRVNRLRECQASLRSPRRQRLAVRSRHPARRELTSAERAVPLIMRTVTPETRRRRESSSQVSHFSQIPFTPLYQPFSPDLF